PCTTHSVSNCDVSLEISPESYELNSGLAYDIKLVANIYAVTTFPNEHENRSAERVELQRIVHQRTQPVVSTAHIHGLRCEVYFRARRYSQHALRSALNNAAAYRPSV